MAFLLNPYEADLDLSDKEDRKLFAEASKGLKDGNLFDGKRENFSTFSKLIEKEFHDVRIMQCLNVPTLWNVGAGTAAERRTPIAEGMVDFFSSFQGSRRELQDHCDLVWASTTLTNTPRLFDIFQTGPTTTEELNDLRNQRRLRHIILGNKLWASLTPDFQIELSGKTKEFKKGNEYDGPLLWDFIRRRVNPTTTVGASKLKEELENTSLDKFGDDIIKYNAWFDDMRTMIIRDEGPGKYNEYLRNLFRAYLTCSVEEFVDAVKDERRKWMQGKLTVEYDYGDLMDLGRVTYNNLIADDEWKKKESKLEKNKASSGDEKNFLMLATEILRNIKDPKPNHSGSSSNEAQKTSDGGIRLRNGRELKAWRFENPKNEQTKILKDGTVMRWCTNDCHPKPMWCGRSNCLNKAEYAAKNGGGRKNEKKEEKPQNLPVSEDFKIALAAMTSTEDFETLKNQFFQGK